MQNRALIEWVLSKAYPDATIQDSMQRIEDIAENLYAIVRPFPSFPGKQGTGQRGLEEELALEFPEWVRDPDLEGYDRRQLLDYLYKYLSINDLTCANEASCRRVVAGPLLFLPLPPCLPPSAGPVLEDCGCPRSWTPSASSSRPAKPAPTSSSSFTQPYGSAPHTVTD